MQSISRKELCAIWAAFFVDLSRLLELLDRFLTRSIASAFALLRTSMYEVARAYSLYFMHRLIS